MFTEELKNIKSGKKEIRQFGITMAIVLGLLGGLFLWKQKSYIYFFVIAGIFLLFGLILPKLLKPIHKAWMALAVVLGWIMTRVILSILFFLIVTPVGLLAKLFGKKFLETKFEKNISSYWITKNKVKFEKSNYERQF